MNWEQPESVRFLALGATAVALWVLAYVAAEAPTPEGKRLGLRGLKRERALQQVPFWSGIEPLVRWIGARITGLVMGPWRTALDRKLVLGGDFLGLLPEELVSLSLLSALVGLAVAALFSALTAWGPVALWIGVLLGAALPYMKLSATVTKRARGVNRRLPYAIDLLALCMGAGLDFPGAVRQTVEKSASPEDPVVEEFTLILQSLQLGQTRRQALECFAERVPVDSAVEFVGSVVQAELHGNPLAEVLRIQAEVSRRQRSVRAEELASRAGVAMIGPLFLVFIAILIMVVGPVFMRVQNAGF
ncbi:MAG TPA: type II secretion system F family protein [Polyangiaceae bacterium]|nr:type II secretion system F family protein [Polyangiaceae bacterium]